jgi:hypothetical protein
MSDNPQENPVTDEEVTPADGAVSEDEPAEKPAAPKAEDADGDDVPFSAEKLRSEIEEIGSRAKSAGLKPFRHMLRSYLDQTLDAVDGLLSALEGNKRKKGD